MIRVLRPITFAAVVAVAAGCGATGAVTQGYEQEHTIVDAPGGRYDLLLSRENVLSSDTLVLPTAQAWKGLVETYASLGVPLQGADGEHHMIATQPFHVHVSFAGERLSRWLDCGQSLTGDNATSYLVTLRLGSIIDTAAAGRSVVRTAVNATAVSPGSGTTPVECSSRGALEKRIAALVASKSQ